MSIGVTGATGFVGRRLILALREGSHVVALARSPDKMAVDNVSARRWDLASSTPEQLKGIDTLYHVAAHLPTNYAAEDQARACLDANALGTLQLMSAAATAGVKTVIVFSSGNAYAWMDRPVSEVDALYPSRRAPFYLASKVCAEVFADHFDQTGRMRVVIVRPSAIYGPGMADKGLVPTLARRLRAREAVRVDDGGRYAADFVYVDDVIDAAIAAAHADVHGSFNVGSGAASSTLEVALTLASVMNVDATLVEVASERSGPPDRGFATLDITRARLLLGYTPRTLRDGLSAYVASLN